MIGPRAVRLLISVVDVGQLYAMPVLRRSRTHPLSYLLVRQGVVVVANILPIAVEVHLLMASLHQIGTESLPLVIMLLVLELRVKATLVFLYEWFGLRLELLL